MGWLCFPWVQIFSLVRWARLLFFLYLAVNETGSCKRHSFESNAGLASSTKPAEKVDLYSPAVSLSVPFPPYLKGKTEKLGNHFSANCVLLVIKVLPTLYRNPLDSERTEAKGFEKFPIKLVLITVLLLAIQFQLPLQWVGNPDRACEFPSKHFSISYFQSFCFRASVRCI